MKSLWNDAEAEAYVDRYAGTVSRDVALRVYTSRLIGRDDTLVLHGGGNTSVKTQVDDPFGSESIEVLCVKGSGWDLASIEPEGLPAVELAPLLRLRGVPRMTDEEMVNQIRIRLLDAGAPTPSVETLLHAFLPHRFVDHTHADAILTLTNQPDGEELIRKVFGDRVVVLPWIMPGYPLANAVADAFDERPEVEGVVLLKHGLFTFGDTARDSYERMIDFVDRAERCIEENVGAGVTMLAVEGRVGAGQPAVEDLAAEILPIVRGALALPPAAGDDQPRRFVVDWRSATDLIAFSWHADCRRLCDTAPLTPDHVIRTKGRYLVLGTDEARDPERARLAVRRYADEYRAYFEQNRTRVASEPVMLDPHPRVVVVEGGGLLAFGADRKAAAVAADIAEHTLRCKARGEAIGCYDALSFAELFDMEYWSLEQAKLGKRTPPVLAGQIAMITGAAGAIGHGIADALLAAGAHVMLTDNRAEGLQDVAAKLRDAHDPSRIASVIVDVTDPGSVHAGLRACCAEFGGLDILVPNAGVAYVSDIAEMDTDRFRQVVDVNLTGTMLVIRAAAGIFRKQGTGGSIVLQASKNVFAPGAGFGAYSASKAAAHQLAKIAALELAALGVRVNMINADAVFGDDVPSGLWDEVGPDRMRARGLDPEGLRDYYRDRSLLKVEVKPSHVGAAVVFFASGATPTTGATLPVDGGVPGSVPAVTGGTADLAIEICGLEKTYAVRGGAPVHAVRGLDLGVRRGEIFGLLGPNGAGKTTTVEICEGLLHASAGTVRVFGGEWHRAGPELRERIGVSLQETRFPDTQTVHELVTLFRGFYTRGRDPSDVVALVGLEDKADSRYAQLSGGQRQRLAVACALVGEPELLFLDEPTTGLDPQSRRRLWDVVQRYQRDGGTVVLTTHYMEEAARLCDRVMIIDHGRSIALGAPSELIATLGAAHVIEIECSGIETELSDEIVGAIPTVHEFHVDGDELVLHVGELHTALPALIGELERRTIDLDRLATRHASLEDVFVHFTGRHLRDDGDDA